MSTLPSLRAGVCRHPASSRLPGAPAAAPLAVLAGLALLPLAGAAQEALTPEDYGEWHSIGAAELSPDGAWFAYQVSPVEGDGWLKVHHEDQERGEGKRFDHARGAEFSDDGRHLAFRIGLPEDEERELREREERVKHDVGIMDLEAVEVDTVSNVESFAFSADGRFLALSKYLPEEADTRGRDVVVRDLHEGTSHLIGNVAEHAFAEEGSLLAYLTDTYDRLGNGAYVKNPETSVTRTLDSREERYHDLTWHDDGTSLAFLRSGELPGWKEDTYEVVAVRGVDGDDPEVRALDPAEHADVPEGHRVVQYRSLGWSDDGGRLFMGIQEATEEEAEDEPAAPDPGADEGAADVDEVPGERDGDEDDEEDPDAHLPPTNVEVWHWEDAPPQPQQQVLEEQLVQSNHLSVWHLDDDRFVQLSHDLEHSLTLTGDQRHAVLQDPEPHRPHFRESWHDIHVVDVETGERTLVVERQESVQPSPGGEYLLYYREGDWYSYEIAADRHRNLTEDLEPRFNNYLQVTGREFDPPFGAGPWAEDDAWVLLYDRYDVHRVSPDGADATRLTRGREDGVQYRHQPLDFTPFPLGAGGDPLDPDERFYLSMFGEDTKDRGYARAHPDGSVETLVYEAAQIGRLTAAEDADVYAYQRQTATESPNFHRTDADFSETAVMTRTNPQQEDYHWADDELVRFTNARGEELEGRLLYPADHDPDERYPMIVYIYEELSQTLHGYTLPSRTSAYNPRRYSSEGYFVLMPDITYEERRPGESAVESVVPAVETVLETGMIDGERIGITGHSWGGYQTNHLVARTDLFSSAVAGAPLTNMISMYNSVYWSTGTPNQTIFEVSQGRLPDPWWEDWDSFYQNSPLHQMSPDTNTPLLLMFGTDDGAVDFNQGVELYVAMRRMQNEFVMLVYEGEGHALQRRENQIDYAERAFQWHEHHLKGKDAPEWIEEGKAHTERPVLEEGAGPGPRR